MRQEMRKSRHRNTKGTAHLISAPGIFGGDVCLPYNSFWKRPRNPPKLWEELLKSRKAASKQQSFGVWGNLTYEKQLVPGTFAQLKLTNTSELRQQYTNCIEEHGAYDEEYDEHEKTPRPFPYKTETQPKVRDWVALFEKKAKLDAIYEREIELDAYKTFYLAFENVLPITMLKNAIVIKDKPLGSVRDYFATDGQYTSTVPDIHRDGISETEYRGQPHVPVGQMLVFEPKDPSKPATGVTTTWYTDRAIDSLVHSRPLAEDAQHDNLEITRVLVYVPKEDAKRAFPDYILADTLDNAEVFQPEELKNPTYVAGGHQIDLPPYSMVIQAANIMGPMIHIKHLMDSVEDMRRAAGNNDPTKALETLRKGFFRQGSREGLGQVIAH